MPTAVRDAYTAFWSAFFGVAPDVWRSGKLRVVPHAALGDYAGVWFFRRGHTGLVSAPPSVVPALAERLAGIAVGRLHDADVIGSALGPWGIQRRIGPAWHGALGAAGLLESAPDGVRRLAESDRTALGALRAACSAEDWGAAGIEPEGDVWGGFRAGQLVAAGRLRTTSLGGRAPVSCDPGIVTRPDARGAGAGLGVAAACVAHGVSQGWLARYQTLAANRPARAIAARLGFVEDARHVAVRLAPERL